MLLKMRNNVFTLEKYHALIYIIYLDIIAFIFKINQPATRTEQSRDR